MGEYLVPVIVVAAIALAAILGHLLGYIRGWTACNDVWLLWRKKNEIDKPAPKKD